jgi:hypothetical protein
MEKQQPRDERSIAGAALKHILGLPPGDGAGAPVEKNSLPREQERRMESERPNTDPDAGVADDKIAEARERATRIEKDAGAVEEGETDQGDDAVVDEDGGGVEEISLFDRDPDDKDNL